MSDATDSPLQLLEAIGVLPVVVIDDPDDAVPLGRALTAGGIPCAEITLRTSAGVAAIGELAGLDGFLVGAGTVLSIQQLELSIGAGARFIVSPGFVTELVSHAKSRGVVAIPGVATAGEVMNAIAVGVSVVKLFPAEQLGGAAMIAALRGPFPDVRFVPSGGVDIDNAASYSGEAVLTVSTSWVAPRSLIRDRRFDEITERARAFRAVIRR